jgi:lysine-N-methylase
MIQTKPAYFDDFRCLASQCPDSCCKEWGVQVDAESAACYRSLPGALGDRLRQVLSDEDGETVMTILDGRCPMWREDGLCRIQAELGEHALCRVCREFPRIRHDYGDFVELGLELSCPEAARLILNAPLAPAIRETLPGGTEPEYDGEAMEILQSSRQRMLEILSDERYPVNVSLAQGLLYGYQVQGELDGGQPQPFDPETAMDSVREFLKSGEPEEIPNFFLSLEILTQQWQARLRSPEPGPWRTEFRALARYFVNRYWLQAVADYDLYSRVKFTVISCLLIRQLGGDLTRTAQLYAKEIENDADNVDAILDAAYTHPAFTDDKLLGMLLEG